MAGTHILTTSDNASLRETQLPSNGPPVLASKRHVLMLQQRGGNALTKFVCKNAKSTQTIDIFGLEKARWVLQASTKTLDMIK